MKILVSLLLFVLFLIATLSGQSVTSLSGTTKDPSGALIPGVSISLISADTGAARATVSDSQGRYTFSQVQPGTYRITAHAAGFVDVTVNQVELLISSPATVDLNFEKVGAVATTVTVEENAEAINTQDASLGNAVAGPVIDQLPFEARNVIGLLAIQPGVSYLGEPTPGSLNDPRSGAVDGGKSDQANVTLDGVDVNDQQYHAAFASVLRVTLDSVEEFRTTTTNAGAEFGRASGAQVTMLTKSGTNSVHGSAYEFIRNTATSANSFFNNASGLARTTLNRNVYGAAAGGPIKKNKLFFFLNYERRKDASDSTGLRTVPNATFRQGTFTYLTTSGSVATLSPAQVQALDPTGLGEDPAALATFQQYPLPNNNTVGDGLNTAGYLFNAPTPLSWKTYIAKIDYQLNARNTLFWRGNLDNDHETTASGIAEFPGQAPSSLYLANNKGFAAGWTSLIAPNFVSTFRYGLTREGVQTTGSLTSAYADFDNISPIYSTSTGLASIVPTNDFHEDLVWTKGAHTVAFGTQIGLIDNRRASNSNSYSNAFDNALWMTGDSSFLLAANAAKSNNYERQMSNILGYLPELTLKVNYNLSGNPLAQGATIDRSFLERHYDMYVEDSWKVTRGLTIAVGLRYSLVPAITEANGYNVVPSIPVANWLADRSYYASQGESQAMAGPLSYSLASTTGQSLYPFQKDWAPRFAIAYSPQGRSGISKFLFGGAGQTVIRAGWGMFYDIYGQALETSFSNSVGFSTSVVSPPSELPSQVPRYTGFYSVPLSAFPAAPPGGFPQTAPAGSELQGTTVDGQLKAPYTMNSNISIGRQLKDGFFVEVAFVDRQSRRSLIGEDLAMPTNLTDPSSGMSYFQAADLLGQYVLSNTPVQNVPKIAFWEDLWPAAATSTLTATQAIYNVYKSSGGDWTTALYNIDIDCAPVCSKLGKNAIFNSQYVDLFGYRSIGTGNYNGLDVTIRKRLSRNVQFTFNYTWSKCEDLGSSPQSSGTGADAIINAFDPQLNKAVCDYDTTQQFSALGVFQLPFGKNQEFLSNANKVTDGFLGGWQLSTVFRDTTGFPVSVDNGVGFPTDWCCYGDATQTGFVPKGGANANAPAAVASSAGGANIWADPAVALAGYRPTLAGGLGQRNGVRGNGIFNIDLGLSKTFHLFDFHDEPHKLQIRAEAFNSTNTVRFDPASANVNYSNPSTFGKYTTTFGNPRVFQFSARYSF
jgi:Carboxypeptidase regulatory-like domain